MYLIVKGKKPKPYCRGCKAFHAAAKCPRSQPQEVDWAAVKRAGDEYYRQAIAWQEQRRREG